MKLMKLRSKKFSKSNSNNNKLENGDGNHNINSGGEIKWEVRPGGMLVQKRECGDGGSTSDGGGGEGLIAIRVSTVSNSHDITIQSTSTFGELKLILSLVTNLEANEQRLLYKGKEREDDEYLHMVGVRDKDKVLLLEDPAVKERKLGLAAGAGVVVGGQNVIGSPYRTITV